MCIFGKCEKQERDPVKRIVGQVDEIQRYYRLKNTPTHENLCFVEKVHIFKKIIQSFRANNMKYKNL